MEREELELGEVVDVERRPRAGVVVSVRLSAEEADALMTIAEQRSSTISKVAREALADFLTYGPRRGASTGPWTGTVSSSQMGGYFELTYAQPEVRVETAGSARKIEPTPAGR